jgi:chromosome segregation ATPase
VKSFAYGAIALVIWTAVVFGIGRATVPDRSPEVRQWRERAAAVVDSARQTAAAREAEAARREAAMRARADSAEARLAAARRRSAQQAAETAALEQQLAVVATLADTARVRGEIIASQRVELRDLRASLADAQEAMRDLRMDLTIAHEDRRALAEETERLTRLLQEGVEVTRPSPGSGRTLRTLALGIGLGVVGWEIVR